LSELFPGIRRLASFSSITIRGHPQTHQGMIKIKKFAEIITVSIGSRHFPRVVR
jgi:hypothetical protein